MDRQSNLLYNLNENFQMKCLIFPSLCLGALANFRGSEFFYGGILIGVLRKTMCITYYYTVTQAYFDLDIV